MSDASGTARERVAGGIRIALALTAVSLWIYVPYRYAVRPPEVGGVVGTGYAVLFPLSVVLALGALLVAWRPWLLGRLGASGGGSDALRWGLGAYGVAWLAMGVLCVPSLSALAAVSPVKGMLSTVHMSAQHVFLGIVAASAAWRPDAVLRLLVVRERAGGAVRSDSPVERFR